MSSRHRPINGADSPEGIRPYLVVLEDRYEEGDRIKVRVPEAYGPVDARKRAEQTHPGWVGLSAEEVLMEVSRDNEDAEMERGKVA